MTIEAETVELDALTGSTRSRVFGDPLNFGSGPRGWLRAATSFLAVLTLVLIGIQFIFAMYRREVNDPDIWWHMRNAHHLLEQHQFPSSDMYSFTVAGHPWINHEWLSEIPYYLAYRAFGLVGVDAVMFATISLIFLGLLYLSYMETRHFKAAIMACCFQIGRAHV